MVLEWLIMVLISWTITGIPLKPLDSLLVSTFFSCCLALEIGLEAKDCSGGRVTASNITTWKDCTMIIGDLLIGNDITSAMIDINLAALTDVRGWLSIQVTALSLSLLTS
jgi:hypothetical protein